MAVHGLFKISSAVILAEVRAKLEREPGPAKVVQSTPYFFAAAKT
jgi:hypothetical protein